MDWDTCSYSDSEYFSTYGYDVPCSRGPSCLVKGCPYLHIPRSDFETNKRKNGASRNQSICRIAQQQWKQDAEGVGTLGAAASSSVDCPASISSATTSSSSSASSSTSTTSSSSSPPPSNSSSAVLGRRHVLLGGKGATKNRRRRRRRKDKDKKSVAKDPGKDSDHEASAGKTATTSEVETTDIQVRGAKDHNESVDDNNIKRQEQKQEQDGVIAVGMSKSKRCRERKKLRKRERQERRHCMQSCQRSRQPLSSSRDVLNLGSDKMLVRVAARIAQYRCLPKKKKIRGPKTRAEGLNQCNRVRATTTMCVDSAANVSASCSSSAAISVGQNLSTSSRTQQERKRSKTSINRGRRRRRSFQKNHARGQRRVIPSRANRRSLACRFAYKIVHTGYGLTLQSEHGFPIAFGFPRHWHGLALGRARRKSPPKEVVDQPPPPRSKEKHSCSQDAGNHRMLVDGASPPILDRGGQALSSSRQDEGGPSPKEVVDQPLPPPRSKEKHSCSQDEGDPRVLVEGTSPPDPPDSRPRESSYGSIMIDARSGHVVYTPKTAIVEALREGEELVEEFTYTNSNKSEETLRVTITGASNAAALEPISHVKTPRCIPERPEASRLEMNLYVGVLGADYSAAPVDPGNDHEITCCAADSDYHNPLDSEASSSPAGSADDKMLGHLKMMSETIELAGIAGRLRSVLPKHEADKLMHCLEDVASSDYMSPQDLDRRNYIDKVFDVWVSETRKGKEHPPAEIMELVLDRERELSPSVKDNIYVKDYDGGMITLALDVAASTIGHIKEQLERELGYPLNLDGEHKLLFGGKSLRGIHLSLACHDLGIVRDSVLDLDGRIRAGVRSSPMKRPAFWDIPLSFANVMRKATSPRKGGTHQQQPSAPREPSRANVPAQDQNSSQAFARHASAAAPQTTIPLPGVYGHALQASAPPQQVQVNNPGQGQSLALPQGGIALPVGAPDGIFAAAQPQVQTAPAAPFSAGSGPAGLGQSGGLGGVSMDVLSQQILLQQSSLLGGVGVYGQAQSLALPQGGIALPVGAPDGIFAAAQQQAQIAPAAPFSAGAGPVGLGQSGRLGAVSMDVLSQQVLLQQSSLLGGLIAPASQSLPQQGATDGEMAYQSLIGRPQGQMPYLSAQLSLAQVEPSLPNEALQTPRKGPHSPVHPATPPASGKRSKTILSMSPLSAIKHSASKLKRKLSRNDTDEVILGYFIDRSGRSRREYIKHTKGEGKVFEKYRGRVNRRLAYLRNHEGIDIEAERNRYHEQSGPEALDTLLRVQNILNVRTRATPDAKRRATRSASRKGEGSPMSCDSCDVGRTGADSKAVPRTLNKQFDDKFGPTHDEVTDDERRGVEEAHERRHGYVISSPLLEKQIVMDTLENVADVLGCGVSLERVEKFVVGMRYDGKLLAEGETLRGVMIRKVNVEDLDDLPDYVVASSVQEATILLAEKNLPEKRGRKVGESFKMYDPELVIDVMMRFWRSSTWNLKAFLRGASSRGESVIDSNTAYRWAAVEIGELSVLQHKKNKYHGKEAPSDVEVKEAIAAAVKILKDNQNGKMANRHEENSVLKEAERELIANILAAFSNMGHPMNFPQVRRFITNYITIVHSHSKRRRMPGARTVDRILKRSEEIKRGAKASKVDAIRAQKSSHRTRREWFHKLDASFEMLHSFGFLPKEWTHWSKVPPQNIWNVDEMGSSAAKRYESVVCDADRMKKGKRLNYIEELGDNGVQDFHVTIVFISCANGCYIQRDTSGRDDPSMFHPAAPPVFIHSRYGPSKKGEKLKARKKEYGNLQSDDQDPTSEDMNFQYGMKVWVTRNGSMEQNLFNDLASHIIEHLPDGAGPAWEGKKPLFLFLDGHSSRWDFRAIMRLFNHGIFIFVLPSHTSIWSQPNDGGVNLSLHGHIRNATHEWKESDDGKQCDRFDRPNFNIVFLNAWKAFVDEEERDLRVFGSNITTRAWDTTGLYPFSENGSAWIEAAETHGLGGLIDEAETISSPTVEKRPRMKPLILDDEDRRIFEEELNADESFKPHEDAFNNDKVWDLLLCETLANRMLFRYRDSLSSSKPLNTPSPICNAEEIVLEKYYRFERADDCDFFGSAPLTNAERKERRRLQMVQLSNDGDQLVLARCKDNVPGTAIKKMNNSWVVIWHSKKGKDKRPSGYTDKKMIESKKFEIKEASNLQIKQSQEAEDKAAAKRNRRARERQEELANEHVEKLRREKIAELQKDILSAINDASDEDGKSDHVDRAFTKLQLFLEKPFHVSYHGINATASGGSTKACPALVKNLMKDVMTRALKTNKGKEGGSRGRDFTKRGLTPIEQLSRILRLRQEEAGHRLEFVESQTAKEEIAFIQSLLDNIIPSFVARPYQWWNICKHSYRKHELVNIAVLMDLNVTSTGKSSKSPLVADYENAIVKAGLTEEMVCEEIRARQKRLDQLLGIDDERLDSLIKGMSFNDIFDRVLNFDGAAILEASQQASETSQGDCRDFEQEVALAASSTYDDLIELASIYEKRKAADVWYNLDCIVNDFGIEEEEEEGDDYDFCREEEAAAAAAKEYDAIEKLFESLDGKGPFQKRDDDATKNILITMIDTVENYVMEHLGEERITEMCGGTMDRLYCKTDDGISCCSSGTSEDKPKSNDEEDTSATSDSPENMDISREEDGGVDADDVGDDSSTHRQSERAQRRAKQREQRTTEQQEQRTADARARRMRADATMNSNNRPVNWKSSLMRRHRSKEIAVLATGPCFFYSVCVLLAIGGNRTINVARLKEEICDAVRTYPLDRIDQMLEVEGFVGHDKVEQYINTCKNSNSFYGGELEALIVASMFGPVHVIAAGGQSPTVQCYYTIAETGELKQQTVALTDHTDLDSIVPEDWLNNPVNINLSNGNIGRYRNPIYLLHDGAHYSPLRRETEQIDFSDSKYNNVREYLADDASHTDNGDISHASNDVDMNGGMHGDSSANLTDPGDEDSNDGAARAALGTSRAGADTAEAAGASFTNLLQRLLQNVTDGLTAEEKRAVRNALHGTAPDDESDCKRWLDEILASSDSDSVKRKSMQKLRPGTWLNDEIIHYILLMLSRSDAEMSAEDPVRKRCHFFKSFFVSKLLDDDGEFNYKNVKRWSTKQGKDWSSTKPGDIFELDKVFFPINVNGDHWAVAVAFMKEKRIQYYDSASRDGNRYLEGLMRYLKEEHQAKKGAPLPDANEWELIQCSSDTPQQENGFDCGVFLCMFCYHLSLDHELSFNQEDIELVRERIALAILKGDEIFR